MTISRFDAGSWITAGTGSSSGSTAASYKDVTVTGCQVNDVIYVQTFGADRGSGTTNSVVTQSGSTGAWLTQGSLGATLNDVGNIAGYAKVTAAGTVVVRVSLSATGLGFGFHMGAEAFLIPVADQAASPAMGFLGAGFSNDADGQYTVTVPTGTHHVFYGMGDWNAATAAIATNAGTPAGMVPGTRVHDAGAYDVFTGHWLNQSAGSKTYGPAALTGLDATGFVFYIEAASGGTNYTKTVPDPVGITDSVTDVVGVVRSQSDAVGVTDSATATQGNSRTQDDAVGLTDVVMIAQGRTQADPIGITDAATPVQGVARTQGDSVGVTDSATSTQDSARTQDDAVGITDSVTAILGGPQHSVFDNGDPGAVTGFDDGGGGWLTTDFYVLGETVTVDTVRIYASADMAGKQGRFAALLRPGGGIWDGTDTAPSNSDYAFAPTLATSPVLVEGWNDVPLSATLTLNPGDGIAVGYNFEPTTGTGYYVYSTVMPAPAVQASDGFPLYLSALGTPGSPGEIRSGYNNGWTVARWYGADIVVNSSGGGTDYSKTPADDVGITDSASAAQAIVRSADDPVGITDSATAAQDIARTVPDAVGVTDAATAAQDLARTQSDGVGISDAVTLDAGRQVDDPVGVTDSATATQANERTITEVVGITDSVTATLTGAGEASVNDPVGISDTATPVQDLVRTQGDGVGITDSVTAAQTFPRTVDDTVGITDSVTYVMSHVVTIEDLIGILDDVAAERVTGAVEVDDPVGITDSVTWTMERAVTVDDIVGITDTATGVLNPPAEICWPDEITLTPDGTPIALVGEPHAITLVGDGSAVTLIPEGRALILVEDGCRP
jgi:hypothetical protein